MKKIIRYVHQTRISILMAAMVLVTASGCSKRNKQADKERFIAIKGSDTMVHLISTWAEAFMKKYPGVEISVTGGGSGTGIAALINGTTDICAASRDMMEKEKVLAEQRAITPKEIIVARDGIAVIVNPVNPVGELTLEDLQKIFTGLYTRWSNVGGPDEEIIVISRESSSGTFVFFQEHVLKRKDYIQNARLMSATSAIIQSVSADKLAIGYVGLGYALAAKDKVKIIAVKTGGNSLPISPSEETVRTGKYSIARPLFLYTNGQATGRIKDFLDFCLSIEGQAIARETGYVAVEK